MCDISVTTNGAAANKANNIRDNAQQENGGKTINQMKCGDAEDRDDFDTVDSGPKFIQHDVTQFVPAAAVVQVPVRVNKNDRNKFSGSLPNNLDTDEVCEENGMTHFKRSPKIIKIRCTNNYYKLCTNQTHDTKHRPQNPLKYYSNVDEYEF